jgi:60 kDa SS-A/Ro ribonucleoprotein
VVRRYEAFKRGVSRELPDVPFQLLTHLPLGPAEWRTIAERATWHQTRMNLNTFARRGLFSDALDGRRFAGLVARRLADPALVRGARVFPYQLLAAYLAAGPALPDLVRAGLQKAMDVSLENVPALEGQVYVCPDVSGSMSTPVTGHRRGATTAVRCVDVAALLTAAVLRRNPTARVLPFEQDVVTLPLDPRASVLENARRLASIGGGGTNCSAPLARLNRAGARGDLVIYVSDNESWCDPTCARGTATLTQWQAFRARNPGARMACVDLQPHGTVQAPDREDVLNVGGFSDHVFTLLADFAAGRLAPGHWVSAIERIDLDAPLPPRAGAPDAHGAAADEGTTIN